MKLSALLVHVTLFGAVLLTTCTSGGGGTDSNTNFLGPCGVDSDCTGGLACVCLRCTRVCESHGDCTGLPGAACLPRAMSCSGAQSTSTCGVRCTKAEDCPLGDLACVEGWCSAPRVQHDASTAPPEAGPDVLASGGAGGTGASDAAVTGGRRAVGGGPVLAEAGRRDSSPASEFCNFDGLCQEGKETPAGCTDCPEGFWFVTVAPGPADLTGIVTLGHGVSTTAMAVDDFGVFFGSTTGAVLRFDLRGGPLTTLASGLASIDAVTVTSSAVHFIAAPPAGGNATMHVLVSGSGSGGALNTGVAARPPLLADTSRVYLGQAAGLIELTDLRGQGGSRGIGSPLLDAQGRAYALTPASLLELTSVAGGTVLYRANRASAIGETTSVSSTLCTDCGGVASSGSKVFVTNGQLVLWDDAASTARTMDAYPASGPVATDGVTVYYASGVNILRRPADPDIAPPAQGAELMVQEAPLALWVTSEFLLWTVPANGNEIELRIRRK